MQLNEVTSRHKLGSHTNSNLISANERLEHKQRMAEQALNDYRMMQQLQETVLNLLSPSTFAETKDNLTKHQQQLLETLFSAEIFCSSHTVKNELQRSIMLNKAMILETLPALLSVITALFQEKASPKAKNYFTFVKQ